MNPIVRFLQVLIPAVALMACAPTATSESTGQYIDDTAITSKVKAAFVDDEAVSALAVNVETFKGVVQLSGFANSEAERRRAEQLARSVDGVKSVKNEIALKSNVSR